MGSSNNNNQASLARDREASLRRSFMAIHRPHSPTNNFEDSVPSLSSPDVSPNVNASVGSTESVHRDGGNKALRRRSSVTGTSSILRQRSSFATSMHHSPTGPAITQPLYGSDGRHGLELPFTVKDEHGESQEQRSTVKKIERRSSAITADDAHKTFVNLTNEKRYERRHSMEDKLRRQNRPASPPPPPSNMKQRQASEGFRKDYVLGESLRHPSHSIEKPSIEAISAVQKHDFVFIRRSNGSLTYAILAFRSSSESDESMTFVISDIGSTKTVRRRHWNCYVRLVSTEGLLDHPTSTTSTRQASIPTCPLEQHQPVKEPSQEIETPPFPVCQEIDITQGESEDYVPDIIMFDKAEVMDDECSLISSVSDRARMLTRRRNK